METRLQKTIAREGRLSGAGIHTGENTHLFFKPAPVDSGIVFFNKGQQVDYTLSPASAGEESLRCSAIGEGSARILTVEHLLAAVSALQISNLIIEVDGPEIPALDGSAAGFMKFFKQTGLQEQSKAQYFFKIEEPLFCYENNKALCIYPDDHYSVAYILDYQSLALGTQKAEFRIEAGIFETEIAPARTFCTEEEADFLKKKGFGKGANFENTLVFSKSGVIQNTLRFDNECARHKVLDLVGDMVLVGFPIVGKVVGLRSGHSLNRKLVDAIKKERQRHG